MTKRGERKSAASASFRGKKRGSKKPEKKFKKLEKTS
jgi:hypothetical protein